VNRQQPLQFFPQQSDNPPPEPVSPLSTDFTRLTDQQLVNILLQIKQHDTSHSGSTVGPNTADNTELANERPISDSELPTPPLQVTGVARSALSVDALPRSVVSFSRPDQPDEQHWRQGSRKPSENPWNFSEWTFIRVVSNFFNQHQMQTQLYSLKYQMRLFPMRSCSSGRPAVTSRRVGSNVIPYAWENVEDGENTGLTFF
jgi:hypothetical protein